jgi:argininosuccinate lyase
MPQKRNPDCAELIRGKCGRVYGSLFSILTTLKGLPLCYNKDLQEDKEGVFDAVRTTENCLLIMSGMISGMEPQPKAMMSAMKAGFLNATELADYLASKGLPFRDAHHLVGALVLHCEREGKTLEELTDEELQEASPLFGSDVRDCLDYQRAVERRTSRGGTAPVAIKEQKELLLVKIGLIGEWLKTVEA